MNNALMIKIIAYGSWGEDRTFVPLVRDKDLDEIVPFPPIAPTKLV